MSVDIFIFGNGGHSRSCVELIIEHPEYQLAGFVISDREDSKSSIDMRVPLVEEDEFFKSTSSLKADTAFTLGLAGRNPNDLKRRHKFFNRLQSHRLHLPPLVHPKSTVARDASISDGAQLFANSRVGPNVMIGPNSVVNTGSIIEHDVSIGTGCFVAPGAILLGSCVVEDYAFIGAGAVVLPDAVIVASAFVKAGEIARGKK